VTQGDDLISRAAALEYLMTNMGWRDEDGYEVDDADEKKAIITDLVNGIPAVDAAPVVHGSWLGWHHHWAWLVCDRCNEKMLVRKSNHGYIQEFLHNYCPACGAKMDKET